MRRLFFLFFILLSAAVLNAADVPEVFNYQGRLLDDDGHALGGSREAVFGLYADPAGGTVLWEQKTTIHADSNGLFNVTLGHTNSLSKAVGKQFNGLYLDMAFKVSNVMVPVRPRPQFVSSAYAKLAEHIASANALTVSSNLTVGQKAVLDVLNVNEALPTRITAEQLTVPRVQGVTALSAYTGGVVRIESPVVFHHFAADGAMVLPAASEAVPYTEAPDGTWYQAVSDRWLSFSGVAKGQGISIVVKLSSVKPVKMPHQITDDNTVKEYRTYTIQGTHYGLCVPVPAGWWFGYYADVTGSGAYYNMSDQFGSIQSRWIKGL